MKIETSAQRRGAANKLSVTWPCPGHANPWLGYHSRRLIKLEERIKDTRQDVAEIKADVKALQANMATSRADRAWFKDILQRIETKVNARNGHGRAARVGGIAGLGGVFAGLGVLLDWIFRRGGP